MQLHAFVFNETFKTLQGQGSAINLSPWYCQTNISIVQVSFVCGNDEVVLVDSSAQVRIFSFVTLQFRCVSFPFRLFFIGYFRHFLIFGNVDQRPYNCNRSRALYTRLLMDRVSSCFRRRTRDYHSPHIIGRRSAPLAEFPLKFQTFHSKEPS